MVSQQTDYFSDNTLDLYSGDVQFDLLCGLVVRVLGYRSGGSGSIPGTTRKKCSGSGTECTLPREYKLKSYLIEK
jgi:hypothetical protein